jgi:hypothetical protein
MKGSLSYTGGRDKRRRKSAGSLPVLRLNMVQKQENIIPYEEQERIYQKDLHEYQEKIYQDTMGEWRDAYNTQVEMDRIFNTSIVSSSAGAFGISFAFINTIVPVADAAFKYLLVASWSCFALCLIIMITSFLASAHLHYKICNEIAAGLEARYQGKQPNRKPRGGFVIIINFISTILFMSGIICLIGFVLLNV